MIITDHWSSPCNSAILVKVSCEITLRASAGLQVNRFLLTSGIFANEVSDLSPEKPQIPSTFYPRTFLLWSRQMCSDMPSCIAADLCPFTHVLRFSTITCTIQHKGFSLLVSNLRLPSRFPGWGSVVSAGLQLFWSRGPGGGAWLWGGEPVQTVARGCKRSQRKITR